MQNMKLLLSSLLIKAALLLDSPLYSSSPPGDDGVGEIDRSEILAKVRDLAFVEKFAVAGRHARVDNMEKIVSVNNGIEVEFIITATVCNIKLNITQEQLYSNHCPLHDPITQLVCRGVLPSNPRSSYSIKCLGVQRLEEQHDTTSSTPDQRAVKETAEQTDIAISIKRLVATEGITVNGRQARFERLLSYKKFETVTEVEFTVADISCVLSKEVMDDNVHYEPCTEQGCIKRKLCRGVISLVPGVKDAVGCEELSNDIEEADLSIPRTSNMNYTIPSADRIISSIKTFVFTEGIVIKGRHARVEELMKHEVAITGVYLEFTISKTRCAGKSKASLKQIYSDQCAPKDTPEMVYCKGFLPFQHEIVHTIICLGANKIATQNGPSTGDDNSVRSVEYSRVLRFVEKFIFIEKMSVNDYYVRVNKVSKYEMLSTGIDAIFAVRVTTCSTQLKITLDKLYSSSCPLQWFSETVVCMGILPFQLTTAHSISCVFGNGTTTPLYPTPSDPKKFQVVESKEVTEISTHIKRVIANEQLIINGRSAVLDALILHKKVENGTEVQFTIKDAACVKNVQTKVQQLYGQSCTRLGYGKLLICMGIISTVPGVKDEAKCSERNDLGEIYPNDLLPERIMLSIRKHMFSETMTINGQHVRVQKLIEHETVNFGVLVEFTITETVCSGKLKITMEDIYSQRCAVKPAANTVVCKGFLPLEQGVGHKIKCSGGDKLTGLQPSHPSIPDDKNKAQCIDVLLKERIKNLIFTERFAIQGNYTRVDSIQRAVKVHGGTEVEFTIAATVCELKLKITLKRLYSSLCSPQQPTASQVCKGNLPSNADLRHSIKCVDVHAEEVDLPRPSTPGNPLTEQEAIERIAKSVKEFLFAETMTVNGHHARLEKLLKYEVRAIEVKVEFTISETKCNGKLKIPMELIYSEECPGIIMTNPITCEGTLPNIPGFKPSIHCSDGDKFTKKTGFTESPAADGTATVAQTAEYFKVVHRVERLVFIEKVAIDGYYARVEKLTKYDNVPTGHSIVFTLRKTFCTTKVMVTIEQVYSASCALQTHSDPVVCKGILPFQQVFMHQIKCAFIDGTEKLLGPIDQDPMGVEVVENEELAYAATQIKRLLVTKHLTIHGHYARLDTVIKHKDVRTGIEVQFTIAETACDSSLQVTVEQLHSQFCALSGHPRRLICVAIISTIPGISDDVKCSERDDIEERSSEGPVQADHSQPSDPGSDVITDPIAPNTEEVTVSIKKFMFSETMTINRHHVRVGRLVRSETAAFGMLVEFALAETTCSDKLKVTLEDVYSHRCNIALGATTVLCKGLLRHGRSDVHQIRCSGGDKFTEPRDPTFAIPGKFTETEAADKTEIIISIKRLLSIQRITINEQRAHFEKLISYERSEAGIKVTFAVTDPRCDSTTEISANKTHSESCTARIHNGVLICKGLLSLTPGIKDAVECEIRNGTADREVPTKPSVPGSDTTVPVSADIMVSVKKLMFSERMTIEGHHVRVEKLIRHEIVSSSAALVEFTIAKTLCRGKLKVTLEAIYSDSCTVVHGTSVAVCKGLLPLQSGISHTIKCSDGDKLTENQPTRAPTSNGEETQESVDSSDTMSRITRLVFVEKFAVDGRYSRVHALRKAVHTDKGIEVEFPITATTCNITEKITLEEVYSTSCPPLLPITQEDCNGFLPSNRKTPHTIKCTGPQHTKPQRDPTSPISGQGKVAETAKEIAIKTSIKKLIKNAGITIRGRQAHFEKLLSYRRVDVGIEVEFIIADTSCDGTTEVSTALCTKQGFIKRLLCKGVLSLAPNGKDAVNCEEQKDNVEQIDESQPFTPGDMITDPATTDKVTMLIKQLMFIEAMTIKGHYARVEKLLKYENVTTGFHVEFTLSQTKCNGQLQIPMELIYSETCSPMDTTTVVTCKGILPHISSMKHSITCSDGDKLTTVVDHSTSAIGSETTASVQGAEYAKVMRKVERLVFMEKVTIGGYYARVDNLTKYEETATGIGVAFTIRATTCSAKVMVTIDKLYSDTCSPQSFSDPLVCKGILPFQQAFMHHITCSLPDGTEWPLAPSAQDPKGAEVLETAEMAQVTVQIKQLMINKHLTIGGHHARLETLIKYKKLQTGIEVQFTIVETTCNSGLQLTVQQLYGPACTHPYGHGKKLICIGIISTASGSNDHTKCSERDDVEEDAIADSAVGNTEHIVASIRKVLFSGTITINGHYVRVDKLVKHKTAASGTVVEFTITETACSEKLQMSLEILYSHSCPSIDGAMVITCKGFLPLSPMVGYSISCSGGRRLTEVHAEPTFEPGEPVPDTTDGTYVATLLKRLMYNERRDICGYYPRLISLDRHEHVDHGVLQAYFTIAPSNCTALQKVSLEELYTNACPANEHCSSLACEGSLYLLEPQSYSIRCSVTVTFSGKF